MEPEHSNGKMSKVILKYASDYIARGTTLRQRQANLELVVLAWNLSLFPEEEREKQMDACLRDLRALNYGSKDLETLKHNLAILIEKKLAEFPLIKKLIIKAQISITDRKECLHVASIDFEQSNR